MSAPNLMERIEKAGGLIRHRPEHLDADQLPIRTLWLRPSVCDLLRPGKLDADQLDRVKAMLKRFTVGGELSVVTKDATREVSSLGDIRDLKGYSPPFVEMRFKPPRNHLRFFGRFVGQDTLVITSYGMKEPGASGQQIDVRSEQKRCNEIFKTLNLSSDTVPSTIEQSLTNAKFV